MNLHDSFLHTLDMAYGPDPHNLKVADSLMKHIERAELISEADAEKAAHIQARVAVQHALRNAPQTHHEKEGV